MQLLDWLVLCGTTLFIIIYGLWKNKQEDEDIATYLRSGHTLSWFTIALSVISTQASAVTFLSVPGQAYTDGMRFVLFYLGMPLAMVFICVFILPVYYRLNIVTAYEFLETKFDAKVRVLIAFFFLIQRSLAAGISLAAPSIVLSVMLGWNFYYTNIIVGSLVVLYTVLGGSDAISQTQKLQMIIILAGMAAAGYLVVHLLPKEIGFVDALRVAGTSGKLNTIDWSFDWDNKYTIWSGLIGGFFLQMAYFGTDQSQVGRYLGGSTITQSRMGLLFNGMFKLPMQFSILLIGALLFVFYQYEQPPISFDKTELQKISKSDYAADFAKVENKYDKAFKERKEASHNLVKSFKENNPTNIEKAEKIFLDKEKQFQELKKEASKIIKKNDKDANTNDANYIFLTFVTNHIPVGMVGLLIAVILFASMSTTASELNALTSTSMVDMYKRLFFNKGSDKHYIWVSKIMTILWGILAIFIAQLSLHLGTLVEVVNMLGSWFYGTILGVFLLAFFSKNLKSNAVFIATLITEILIIAIDFKIFPTVNIAYLWLNVVGSIFVITLSYLFNFLFFLVNKAKK
ncbi:MAG: sodium:solute symporter [Bacteroidetes bacterium]|nr:MAG: sodium:solute symporter [Bacteroidota bacterium]TAG94432.1 MAG: sodium:solute symporter [Bacteroidota bacterium]